ncbi:MAG: hypothetical protein IPJ17_01350 [Holophagales bacterium]|nr:MAG: hypothetical protein IPJ17_01350 [Holophagales bacterium]
MLDDCAPKHTREEKTHKLWIYFDGKRFLLPRGRKGDGFEAEIQRGQLKGLIKELGLQATCVGKHFPGIV